MTLRLVSRFKLNRQSLDVVYVNLGALFSEAVQVGAFPIVVPLLLEKSGQSTVVAGFAVAIQWATVFCAAAFVPKLVARYGEKIASMVGVGFSVAAVALLLAALSYVWICVAAFLMGLGLILRWVACDAWIIRLAPQKWQGRAVGIHETLLGLGITLGPILLLLSAEVVFKLVGILTLTLCLAMMFFGLPQAIRPYHTPSAARSHALKPARLAITYPLICLAALVSGGLEIVSISFLPIYFIALGFDQAKAIGFIISFGLGVTILQLLIGYLSDRMNNKLVQALCGVTILLGSGALLLGVRIGTSAEMMIVIVLFILGGAIGGLNTLAVIEAGSAIKKQFLHTVLAVIAMSYTLGSTIGPAVAGILLEQWGASSIPILFASVALVFTILRVAVGPFKTVKPE